MQKLHVTRGPRWDNHRGPLGESYWTIAFSFALFAIAGALAIPTSWWSYMHGYYRARADLLEAFSRAESSEEFARLATSDPPKPWE